MVKIADEFMLPRCCRRGKVSRSDVFDGGMGINEPLYHPRREGMQGSFRPDGLLDEETGHKRLVYPSRRSDRAFERCPNDGIRKTVPEDANRETGRTLVLGQGGGEFGVQGLVGKDRIP